MEGNEVNQNLNDIVYAQSVIEFITVATDYCKLMESRESVKLSMLLEKLQLLLPELYIKTIKLPNIQTQYEEVNEKFVSEQDYEHIRNNILKITVQYDEFNEVYDEKWYESEEPITSSISENLADIYQDLKDFLTLYNVGTFEIMNDAIWECKFNFGEFWGQKLTNTLRAIHNLKYNQNLNLDNEE